MKKKLNITLQSPPKANLVVAFYGNKQVTQLLRNYRKGNTHIRAWQYNTIFGDPMFGILKSFNYQITKNGAVKNYSAR